MKSLILVLAVMSLAGVVSANCGNGNGNGNGCNGNTGPQGPQGPAGNDGLNGTNGSDGTNGANGTNGADGKDGKDGKDGRDASARVMPVVDLAVRVYDGKYVQLQAFNVWRLADHNKLAGAGTTEFMAGARIVLKLGKSYEERRLDALEKKLQLLSR